MAFTTVLNDTPERLIDRFRQALVAHHIPVDQLIIFGSYARGNPKPWSDLDVCVVSPSFGKNRYDETVLLTRIASDVEPMIEAVPFHPDGLTDPYDPLAAEIRKNGKLVA